MEAQAEGRRPIPRINDPAPDFTAMSTHGEITLSQFLKKGKWVLLFAHPADFTPVCTTEFIEFARRYKEFKDLACEIIGLSVDSIYSHIEWLRHMAETDKVKVEFPVVADPDKEGANLYDLINPAGG